MIFEIFQEDTLSGDFNQLISMMMIILIWLYEEIQMWGW